MRIGEQKKYIPLIQNFLVLFFIHIDKGTVRQIDVWQRGTIDGEKIKIGNNIIFIAYHGYGIYVMRPFVGNIIC